MTTTTHRPDHPALALPAPERVAYLDAVASFVIADGTADDAELGWLGTLCEDLGLEGPAREEVFASARRPDPARTEATLARLRHHTELCFALITDATVIVLADRRVDAVEAEQIARIARALEVTTAQCGLLARYVEQVLLHEDGRSNIEDVQRLTHELMAGVMAADAREHAEHPAEGAIRRLYRRLVGKGGTATDSSS